MLFHDPDLVVFSATASAKGVRINTGSCSLHAPRYLSVHHPLLQMLLFADVLLDGTFICHRSLAPKIFFDTTQPSGLCIFPIVYVAGWKTGNAGRTPIFTHQMLTQCFFEESMLIQCGSTVLMCAPDDCVMTPYELYCGVSNESTFELGRAVSEETDYQQQGMLAGGSHVARLQVSTAPELACITTADAVPATPQSGDDGFFLHSANAKGDRVRKNIFTLSTANNGNLEGTSSTLTGGNGHRETYSASSDMPVVILDSQAQASCTGNFAVLSNHKMLSQDIVLVAANGQEMPTFMSGSVRLGRFQLDDVHFCPEVGDNRIIVSGSVLDNLGYHYGYGSGKCYVKDLRTGRIVGEGHLVNGDYIMDYLEIPRDRTPEPEHPALVSSLWNTFCSALRRLGLNPQGH